MVQVLPYVPSFGEKLSASLAESGSQIAQALEKRHANTALQKLLANTRKSAQSNSPLDQMQQSADQNNEPSMNSSNILDIYKLAKKAHGEEGADQLIKSINDERKIASKESEIEHKHELESYKLTKDYREQLLDAYEGSKRTMMQLDRLEELNKDDKLATPTQAKLSEVLGIPLSVLSNPQSEEFLKLSQDLMSNITKYFGNRILQVEVENFLKTIPTLMNSKEGRQRVIDNMKMLLEGPKLAYEEYKDIRKKKGKIPLDLHEQVLEGIEPKLDSLAERFRRGAETESSTQNSNSGFTIVMSPDGMPHRIPNNQVDQAIKAGGKLR